MKLIDRSLEDLRLGRCGEDFFIEIPLLYHPLLKEIHKRKENLLALKVLYNRDIISPLELLLTICRLFGLPETCSQIHGRIQMVCRGVRIALVESDVEYFSLEASLIDGLWDYNHGDSSIKVKPIEGEISLIVLPEGDGIFYMKLDKIECAAQGRRSIIGDPDLILSLFDELKELGLV